MGCGDVPLRFPLLVRIAWIVPAAILTFFLATPLINVLAQLPEALGTPGGWTGALDALPLALAQAATSTVLTLLIGLPLCAVITRVDFPGRAGVEALVTVPFVLPTVVVALAIRSLLGSDAPLGFGLVVAAHVYVNLAIVLRLVGASWLHLDPSLTRAARTLGASGWTAFRTVTLPALRGPISTSAAVVFAFSFTSLGIALLLGGGEVRTLEMLVLRQSSVLLDTRAAALTATLQLVVVTAVLLLGTLFNRRQRTAAPHRLAMPRGGWARIGVMAVALLTCLIVLAPILALGWASIRASGHFTLDWWARLGSIDAGTTRIGTPMDALRTSLLFAAATAAIAMLIGGLAALGSIGSSVGRSVALFALAPLGISAATLGLGLALAFGRPPLDLRELGLLVPMAHALVAIPLVVAVAQPALRGLDDRRRAVAATLGAAPLRAFLTAYGPTIRVVAFAAAGLAAAVSLGEFGAASFLARAGNPTVPLVIARLLGRPGPAALGTAAAMAMLLAAATWLLVLAVDRAGRRAVRA